MQAADALRWIWRSLRATGGRSLLTSLGIAIGVAAVTLLTSIGEGLRSDVLEGFAQFGTRLISVTPGKLMAHGAQINTVKPLTLEDAEAIDRIPHMVRTLPVIRGTARLEAGQRSRDVDVVGGTATGLDIWKMSMMAGQFLPAGSENAQAHVVLGPTLKQELFGADNALGQFVRISGMRFRVIGITAPKGRFLDADLDDMAYIPTEQAQQLFNVNGVMEINIEFSPNINTREASQRVRQLLIERHNEEDFTLFTQEDMMKTLDNILSKLTMAVAALGGISLLVGGVGVLTIMTTALAERTSEIGLLRALGTPQSTLLGLFLGEAVALATLGGLTGVSLIALLVAAIKLNIPGLPVVLAPGYMLLSLMISAAVGAVAGLAPAIRASQLDPIEALRAE